MLLLFSFLLLVLSHGRVTRGTTSVNVTPDARETQISACTGDDSVIREQCMGCDGVVYSGNSGPYIDACGVCGGDGSTCCGADGLCSNHGYCSSDINGCFCDNGYGGEFCTHEADLCRNKNCDHGTCDENSGMCMCFEGYAGKNCSRMDCGENGIPHKDESCKCRPGYIGTRCDECGSVDPDSTYLCAGKHSSYRLIKLDHDTAEFYAEKTIAGTHYFDPATHEEYDCRCRRIDTFSNSLPRYFTARSGLVEEDYQNVIEFLLNQDFNFEELTSEQLAKETLDFQDRIDSYAFKYVSPIIILGVICVAIFAVILIVIGIIRWRQ